MVEIERLGGKQKPVQLVRVAGITGISRRYLEQLAIALKSHSLLRGISGRKGGYVLARPASEITIGDVLTAVIGPINLSVCVVEPDVCMRTEFCECRLIWTLLNRRVNQVLDEYTVADLLNKEALEGIRRQVLEETGGEGVIGGGGADSARPSIPADPVDAS